jgi:hypothetical protein
MKEDAVVTVFTLDSVLNFGKHKGKTVREVMETAPGYIVWAYNNVDWFGVPADVYEDACILAGDPFDKRQLKRGVPSEEDTPLFDAKENAQKNQQKLFDDPDDDIPF